MKLFRPSVWLHSARWIRNRDSVCVNGSRREIAFYHCFNESSALRVASEAAASLINSNNHLFLIEDQKNQCLWKWTEDCAAFERSMPASKNHQDKIAAAMISNYAFLMFICSAFTTWRFPSTLGRLLINALSKRSRSGERRAAGRHEIRLLLFVLPLSPFASRERQVQVIKDTETSGIPPIRTHNGRWTCTSNAAKRNEK